MYPQVPSAATMSPETVLTACLLRNSAMLGPSVGAGMGPCASSKAPHTDVASGTSKAMAATRATVSATKARSLMMDATLVTDLAHQLLCSQLSSAQRNQIQLLSNGRLLRD